jgi:UDP-glucose 4-epimerase
MKAIVVGGAGFIGSHLVERLLEGGNKVIVFDNFSTGLETNLDYDNKDLLVINANIASAQFIYYMPYFRGADVVYHLAAKTRPIESIDSSIGYDIVNVHGMLRVLECCRIAGVKRFAFASSSSLYGEADDFPTTEHETPKPMSPYAAQKLMGEEYCSLYSRIYNIPTVSFRFFNVYGTRMRPDGEYASLVPRFIKLMRDGNPPIIFGDGEQTRDFVHIDDVVTAMINTVSPHFAWLGHSVFNIGSGQSYSVNQIFAIIRDILNVDVVPMHTPPVIEPRKTQASILRAWHFLDWQPTISLEDGIRTLIEEGNYAAG